MSEEKIDFQERAREIETQLKTLLNKVNNMYSIEEIEQKLATKLDSHHDHDTRYHIKDEITTLLGEKSNTDHTHEGYVSEATFKMAMRDKAPLDHTHVELEELKDIKKDLANKADGNHSHDGYLTADGVKDIINESLQAIQEANRLFLIELVSKKNESNQVEITDEIKKLLEEKANKDHHHNNDYHTKDEIQGMFERITFPEHEHNNDYYDKEYINKKFQDISAKLEKVIKAPIKAFSNVPSTANSDDFIKLQSDFEDFAIKLEEIGRETLSLENITNLLESRAPLEHDHNDDYYTQSHIDEEFKKISENTYTREEVDVLLDEQKKFYDSLLGVTMVNGSGKIDALTKDIFIIPNDSETIVVSLPPLDDYEGLSRVVNIKFLYNEDENTSNNCYITTIGNDTFTNGETEILLTASNREVELVSFNHPELDLFKKGYIISK